eukprot:TRINITY_DN32520_c0_g1_i3.p1 TRINITY_DN32520_c0_g1~~TRINITY_DN32520_c0_g1_i3.p1  ORF type:complete len:213 (-),score=39.42 TRINITY_DN32520_c0_g1_i3:52-690(-)
MVLMMAATSMWRSCGRRVLRVCLCMAAATLALTCSLRSAAWVGNTAMWTRRSPMPSRLRVYKKYYDSTSGVILPAMHRDEPAWLSFVISRYLDEEWLEQPVHRDIADAVASLYTDIRAAGHNKLVTVMSLMTFGLEEIWAEAGFKEAFEAPWELTNRVSELLLLRLGKDVFSHGRHDSEVQRRMLGRLKDYETATSVLSNALGSSSDGQQQY